MLEYHREGETNVALIDRLNLIYDAENVLVGGCRRSADTLHIFKVCFGGDFDNFERREDRRCVAAGGAGPDLFSAGIYLFFQGVRAASGDVRPHVVSRVDQIIGGCGRRRIFPGRLNKKGLARCHDHAFHRRFCDRKTCVTGPNAFDVTLVSQDARHRGCALGDGVRRGRRRCQRDCATCRCWMRRSVCASWSLVSSLRTRSRCVVS